MTFVFRRIDRCSSIFAVVALAGSFGVLSASAIARQVELGQAEGRLQLAQISALLAGRYDNDPQRYYLEGMKRGASAPPRLHLEIRRAKENPNSFVIEERDGSEHSAVVRSGTLTLDNDVRTRQVVMRLDGASQRCDWRWSRHNGAWLAEAVEGACQDGSSASGFAGKTLWLDDDELWLEGRGAAVPTELGRAHSHECFVAAQVRGGKPQVFMGLKTHDRGGTVDIVTKETPARKLTLTLRRGMWPSNSGNNLLELITLTVREEGQPTTAWSGWATPDSPRVGFGNDEEGIEAGASINARCKRVD